MRRQLSPLRRVLCARCVAGVQGGEEVGGDLGYAVGAPADGGVCGAGDGDEVGVRELREQAPVRKVGTVASTSPEKMMGGRARSGAVVGTADLYGAGQVRHSSLAL